MIAMKVERQLVFGCLPLLLVAFRGLGAEPVPPGQAFEWGYPGQLHDRDPCLAVLTNAVQISSKAQWSLALRADGSLLAWGNNSQGQTNVPAGNDFAFACGGYDCGGAVRSNGTVAVWGATNSWTYWPSTPITDAVEVSLGDGHCAVLHSNGTVTVPYGWRTSVTNVPFGLSNVVHIDSTWYAVVALTRSGNVVSWGETSNPGNYLQAPGPAYTNNISQIACGYFALYSIDSNNVLRCWGTSDQYGELDVPPALTNCTFVAGGAKHTLAIDNHGKVYAWGYNGTGQTNIPTNLTNASFVYGSAYYSGAIAAGTDAAQPPPQPPTGLRVVANLP